MALDENGFVAEPDETWWAQQRAMQTVNCGLCDDGGYRGSAVCDHVDRTDIYKRGMARVRAALDEAAKKGSSA